MAPGKLSFGNIIINRSSVARQLVVTNVGTNPVRIGEVKASGPFTCTDNAPAWLNPGANFIIDVFFYPKNEGISTGGIYVDTNDAKGTEYAELVGYGYVAGTDPGGGESGGGGGVLPKYWNFRGDGETVAFPISGADAYDKLLFDTYVEGTVNASDFYGVNPPDYFIDPPVNGAPPMIRFLLPLGEGINGYTIMRGYAKPFEGTNPPIDTVSPDIVTNITNNNTVINGSTRNSLILINSPTPFTLRLRKNTGDTEQDWKPGDFISVVQVGPGPVSLVTEDGALITPPTDYIATSRAVNCVISASITNPDGDEWLASGDLRRIVASDVTDSISMHDRSVLIGSGMTVGAMKDSYVMPYGLKLKPVAEGGLFASLSIAQTGGNIFTVDILRNGLSILATRIVINNGQKTSKNAVTPATFVPNGDVLSEGDELTLSIIQMGDGSARGLRIYLTGQRT